MNPRVVGRVTCFLPTKPFEIHLEVILRDIPNDLWSCEKLSPMNFNRRNGIGESRSSDVTRREIERLCTYLRSEDLQVEI